MSRELDRVDRRILDALQADARISNQELAKKVGLSPAPCWRRLRRLEAVLDQVQDELLAPLTAADRATLARLLTRVAEHHAEPVG